LEFLKDPSLDPVNYITHEQLTQAMELLASTSFVNSDFRIATTIFWDIQELWEEKNPTWTAKDHSAYVKALCYSGRLDKAKQWLYAMQYGLPKDRKEAMKSALHKSHTKAGDRETSPASREDWHAYLNAHRYFPIAPHNHGSFTTGRYKRIKHTIQDEADSQLLGPSRWKVAARALFEDSNIGKDQLIREWNWIKSQSSSAEKMDSFLLTTGLAGFVRAGLEEEAIAIQQEIRQRQEAGDNSSLEAWNALLQYDARYGDEAAIAETLKNARQAGVAADHSTLLSLLSGLMGQDTALSSLREALGEAEQISGVLSDHQAYELVMALADSFRDALALLQDAQRDGIPSSSGMLQALCLKAQTREDLPSLQEAYSDLLRSRLANQRCKDGVHNPDLYLQLLAFCAREDVGELTWAIQLLEDMRANGLTLPSTTLQSELTASELVISLMKNAATNHSEAFKAYSWTLALEPKAIFSSTDFYNIIRAFADLRGPDYSSGSTSEKDWCAPGVFMAFFEDVEKAGLPRTSRMYQAILHYYARENNVAPSATAVRQLHDIIKTEQYIDPDIGLMNRLMYAFSRNRQLHHALGIWRNILMNNIPYNDVSISIILDVYGRLGQPQQMLDLWSSLKRQNFSLNAKNLETLIEGLFRCQRGKEAFEALCAEASQTTGGVIEVDANTVEVLLKFARHDAELFESIRRKIESDFPEIWQSVKYVATSFPNEQRSISNVE